MLTFLPSARGPGPFLPSLAGPTAAALTSSSSVSSAAASAASVSSSSSSSSSGPYAATPVASSAAVASTPLVSRKASCVLFSDDALHRIRDQISPSEKESLIRDEVDRVLRHVAATAGVAARAEALLHGLRCLCALDARSGTRVEAGSFTPEEEIQRLRTSCTMARDMLPAVARCVADLDAMPEGEPQREQLLSAWFAVAHMAVVAFHGEKDAAACAHGGRRLAFLLEAGAQAFGASSGAGPSPARGYNYWRHQCWLLDAAHGASRGGWITWREVCLVFDSLRPEALVRQRYLEAIGPALVAVLSGIAVQGHGAGDGKASGAALVSDAFRRRLSLACPGGISQDDEGAMARGSGVAGLGALTDAALDRVMGRDARYQETSTVGMLRGRVKKELLTLLPEPLADLCVSYVGGSLTTWIARPLTVQPAAGLDTLADPAALPPAPEKAASGSAAGTVQAVPGLLAYGGRQVPVNVRGIISRGALDRDMVLTFDDPKWPLSLLLDPRHDADDVHARRGTVAGAVVVPGTWVRLAGETVAEAVTEAPATEGAGAAAVSAPAAVLPQA